MKARAWWVILAMSTTGLAAARQPQAPVAIVLSGDHAEVTADFAESAIPVLAGMALFEKDVVRSNGGAVTLLVCPTGEIDELIAGKSVTIEKTGPKADAGALRLAGQSAPCELPSLERGQLSTPLSYMQSRGELARRGSPEPGPAPDLTPEARDALAPIYARLDVNPKDLPARLALASQLSRYGKAGAAISEFARIGDEFPGAVWTRGVITRLELEQSGTLKSPALTGETYALLIGISKYTSMAVPNLLYADRDAETFAEFLKTPRGGGLAQDHVLLLTNENATRDAIDNAVNTFLAEKAGANNTLIIFIAAHGVSVPTERDPQTRRVMLKEPYILTTESNPEETKTSGFPMAEFGELIAQQEQRFAKVLVYVDVCRAGNIKGLSGAPRELEPQVRDAFDHGKGDVGVLLATDARHDAYESELIGNGHGAFTYSVLDALNGAAAPNGQDRIEFYDLRHYVEDHVRLLTDGNQTPVYIETDPNMLVAENLKDKAGIQLPPAHRIPIQHSRQRGRGQTNATPPAQTGKSGDGSHKEDAQLFDEALADGRLLPEQQDGAAQVLERLMRDAQQAAPANLDRARRLHIAFEDRGQAVLLQYLRGDQNPQSQADFERGARYFEEALRMVPGVAFDESRLYFCRGRALIFAKQYEAARELLGRSILLDPLHAYAYNALGIAYLEQIPNDELNYGRALAAFRDATRYAPLWAYPLHNLALTYMQHGDYDLALATYREAMRLAPEYSYLPYNMGLVFQKINRTNEAAVSYRTALRVDESGAAGGENRQSRAMIYNALGTIEAAASRSKAAEGYFRMAIAEDPVLLNAKHNLALLLSRKQAAPEAEALWTQCLSVDPKYLPGRLSLAEYLAREKRFPEAVTEYRLLLAETPEFAAARLELARILEVQGAAEDALRELQVVAGGSQASALVFERIGDLESKAGHPEAARTAYEAGEKAADNGNIRRRLQRKSANILHN